MKERNMTDALVEQSLLDNIDLILYENPSSEELSKIHLAVVVYREFQEALLTKSRWMLES